MHGDIAKPRHWNRLQCIIALQQASMIQCMSIGLGLGKRLTVELLVRLTAFHRSPIGDAISDSRRLDRPETEPAAPVTVDELAACASDHQILTDKASHR